MTSKYRSIQLQPYCGGPTVKQGCLEIWGSHPFIYWVHIGLADHFIKEVAIYTTGLGFALGLG